MLQTWRWFGPEDPVTLEHARQAGATGIVTALHHIYDGRAWTSEDVLERKRQIEAAGLVWSVCESIPMPTAIKTRGPGYRQAIDAWKQSLINLGRAGVPVICYNFMPVVDWTRTDLMYRLPTTGYALRFDMTAFVAYDAFVLRRAGAEGDYAAPVLEQARARLETMDEADIRTLEETIIRGLPGGEAAYTRERIASEIALFDDLDDDAMRANLLDFLREVVPVAQEVGVRLVLHPDDPPFSLFGLPRVVSTAADDRQILAGVDDVTNSLVLCTGSYGSRPDNDLVAMAREFAPRIHFAHLRNVRCEPGGSFHESEHLDGDIDMVEVVRILLAEERRRRDAGDPNWEMPMRPDHGHMILDDIGKTVLPGYTGIGRLKGLAELRGIIRAVERFDQAA